MSNQNIPRGFQPLRYQDNRPYSGGFNTYRVQSGYGTNIFCYDVVKRIASGYINKANAGDQMRGVACGFRWLDVTGIPKYSMMWIAGTLTLNGQDAQVEVIDDPGVQFMAAFTNSTSVPGIGDMGANFNIIDNGGNTQLGMSGEGVDYTTRTLSAAQFQFVEYLQKPDNDPASAYLRGLFVPKLHDGNVTTGI